MAMNGTSMGDQVVAALQLIDPSMTTDQVNQLKSAWHAICGAMVTHIQTNAVVSTNDTGTVTSGIGAGGSVVATGTGTVA